MNYKTLVPSVVGSGILLYEAITGHVVSSSMQTEIVNGVITAIGFGVTLYGIWKNHKKVN
jgi:hypothetical protein